MVPYLVRADGQEEWIGVYIPYTSLIYRVNTRIKSEQLFAADADEFACIRGQMWSRKDRSLKSEDRGQLRPR